MPIVCKKLIEHYNYYGITDNSKCLSNFLFEVSKLQFIWLNRRSQKKSYEWNGFNQMLAIYKLSIPKIKVNIYAK